MNTEIILALISALAGGGLTGLLMVRVNRRAKNVETDGQVAEQWRQYAEKADERYERLRIEKRDLWEKYNKVENQLVYYKTLHCCDVKCANRRPPLGKLLARGVEEDGDAAHVRLTEGDAAGVRRCNASGETEGEMEKETGKED